jgi:hypothetical protein
MAPEMINVMASGDFGDEQSPLRVGRCDVY